MGTIVASILIASTLAIVLIIDIIVNNNYNLPKDLFKDEEEL